MSTFIERLKTTKHNVPLRVIQPIAFTIGAEEVVFQCSEPWPLPTGKVILRGGNNYEMLVEVVGWEEKGWINALVLGKRLLPEWTEMGGSVRSTGTDTSSD